MSTTIASVAEQPDVRTKTAPLNESYLVGSVLAVTAMVYATALGFPFAYDDQGQIVENVLVQSWKYVPQYFKGQVWQYLFPNAPANYYRPLNLLWFRINDALFGLHPGGWHATTLLLHVLATYLVYLLARRLTGRPLVAAAAALVFGVHPMRHGVVAWVSGSTESLWAVLFFAAFLAYLRSREGERLKWMTASCALYALALLSKETAIMLPMIIFLHSVIYGTRADDLSAAPLSRRVAQAARLTLAYVPLAVVYVFVRTAVLHGFSHNQARISFSTLAFTAPSVAWFYARQWLLPTHMSEFYGLALQHRIDFWHVVAPAFGLAALAALLWFARKKLGPREVAFAAVWMIVPLLPAFDLGVFPAGDLVHDRYFYLPSFGAALLLGLALEKLAHGTRVFGVPQKWLLVMLVLLVALAYGTANASSYWIDDYILFEHAYHSAPANGIVRNNYAVELARRQRYTEALPMLKQLLQEQPNNWLANYNYARITYQQGDKVTAEKYYTRAMQIDPQAAASYLQLGLIELQTSRLPEAEANMRRAVSLQPLDANSHFGLGVVLVQRGNCSAARQEFATALALKPELSLAQQESDLCKDKPDQGKAPAPAGVTPSAPGHAASPVNN